MKTVNVPIVCMSVPHLQLTADTDAAFHCSIPVVHYTSKPEIR